MELNKEDAKKGMWDDIRIDVSDVLVVGGKWQGLEETVARDW